MKVVRGASSGQRVPIFIWRRDIAEDTVRQLGRIASQPWVVEHVAAMADAHVSDGVAVGTVFATEHTVVPCALGGDLGCGMSAVRITDEPCTLERAMLSDIVSKLARAIPTGDAVHRGHGAAVPDALCEGALSTRSLERTREALAGKHLGTLGGGNHFLELDRDPEGRLWLLVHSGSRGLGAAIAAHHAGAAGASSTEGTLPALDVREPAGAAYLSDLAWALSFARANRAALVRWALEILAGALGAIAEAQTVDIHHNFVARERWFGRDLLVHRKGAISVPSGTLALIPGSMGTASYLVEGLGHEASFGSCSHGAGRILSRRAAREHVSRAAFARSMRRVVMPAGDSRAWIEEAPAAYRDIRDVLEDQEDLVTRRLRLEPVAVLKG